MSVRHTLAVGVLVCLVAVAYSGAANPAEGAENVAFPRIGLHLAEVPAKASQRCTGLQLPPCNKGSASLSVAGDIDSTYCLYILVVEADSAAGVKGASFGISYGPSISVNDWTLCTDGLEFSCGSWPASGSGTAITWTTCQQSVPEADENRTVTAVLGVMNIYAYGDDQFSITPRRCVGAPDFAISECSGSTVHLDYPRQAGKVGFGDDPGFDPCLGAYSLYSRFLGLSSGELETVQLKFTSVGFPINVINTVGLVATGDSLDVEGFLLSQHDGFLYAGDGYWEEKLRAWNPHVVRVSTGAIAAVLDSVGTIAEVANGSVADTAVVAFSVLDRMDQSVFESIVGEDTGRLLLQKALGALPPESEEWNALYLFACETGLTPYDSLTDVTDDVSVLYEGLRYSETKHEYAGRVRVINEQGGDLPDPVTLVLFAKPPARILNADGVTCALGFGGRYFKLPTMAAGDTVYVTVEYKNPGAAPLQTAARVFAGTQFR